MSTNPPIPPALLEWLASLEAGVDFTCDSAGLICANEQAAAAMSVLERLGSIESAVNQARAGAVLRQLALRFPGLCGTVTVSTAHEYDDQGGRFRSYNVNFDQDEEPLGSSDVHEGLIPTQSDSDSDLIDEVQDWLEEDAYDFHVAAASLLGGGDGDVDIRLDTGLCADMELSARELFVRSVHACLDARVEQQVVK
jgi:hypothetical protein